MAEVLASPVTPEKVSKKGTNLDAGQMSQWQLMVLRFKRNKLAMMGLFGLIVMYIVVFLGPFVAPNEYMNQDKDYIFGGPSKITFINPDGRLGLQPYLIPMTTALEKGTYKFVFVLDEANKQPIHFFVKGDPVTVLGFIKTDMHLFGVDLPHRIYLIGADALGRDLFARLLVGGQISMTIGLVGVAMSLVLGAVIGHGLGLLHGPGR